MGERAGAGYYQGVDTSRPLISTQKVTQKTKKQHNKPRYISAQDWVSMKHGGVGKEVRYCIHAPCWYRQRPGCRSRPDGGGGGSRNGRVRTEPRKDYPKVFTVTIEIMRSEKGGKPDGVQGGINGLAEWV